MAAVQPQYSLKQRWNAFQLSVPSCPSIRHGAPLPAAHPPASSSPSPSVTGPRCRGTACEGGSPMDMRCATAPETLAEHVTATGASVQLRYSRESGTSWTRMWGTRIGDRIESEAVGASAPTAPRSRTAPRRTPMRTPP